jgi:O-antigen ligase
VALGLLCLAVVGLVQWVPLPGVVLKILSPAAAGFWATAPLTGGWGSLSLAPHETLGWAALLVAGAAVHMAAAMWTFTTRRGPWLTQGLVLVTLVVVLVAGLEQVAGTAVWSRWMHLPNPGLGPFPNRNDLAVLAAAVVPLLMVDLVQQGHRLRLAIVDHGPAFGAREGGVVLRLAVVALGMGMSVAVIARGGSRIGVAALAAGALVFALSRPRRALVLGSLVAATCVAGWVVYRAELPMADAVSAEWNVRQGLWGRALRMTAHFPLTGAGLGGFGPVSAAFAESTPRYAVPGHAENDFLELVSEAGVPAATVVLGLGLAWVWGLFRARRRPGATQRAGYLGAAMALCVGAAASFVVTVPGVFLWLALVTGIASGNSPPVGTRGRPVWRPLAVSVLCIVLAVSVVGRFGGAVYWDLYLRQRVELSQQSGVVVDPTGATQRLESGARWDSRSPFIALALAREYEARALESVLPSRDDPVAMELSEAWYQMRLMNRPTDAFARLGLSAWLEQRARTAPRTQRQALRESAQEIRDAAVALDPSNAQVQRYRRRLP